MKYYFCSICKNMLETIDDSGNTPSCCGKTMTLLQPASTDGDMEKHVPAFDIIENPAGCSDLIEVSVHIGSMPHPMEKMHHIEWIELVTNKGVYRHRLKPEDKAETSFYISSKECPLKIYEYCNLHGLWEKVVEDKK